MALPLNFKVLRGAVLEDPTVRSVVCALVAAVVAYRRRGKGP